MNKLLNLAFERKGYDSEFLKSLNDFEFENLKDMDKLVYLLHHDYIHKHEITILSDFDMDGIMAGVIAYTSLSIMGFKVNLYKPKIEMGYSFDENVIDDLLECFPDTDGIITCDNGITSHNGVNYAKSLGLWIFVTDHHIEGDKRVLADVVLDPLRTDENLNNPYICGANVIWQVMMNYASYYRDKDIVNKINRLKVFVGFATISDVMPLIMVNRKIVKDSMKICKRFLDDDTFELFGLNYSDDIYTNVFVNLTNILRYMMELGKVDKYIDPSFVGYYLAPIFNSAKRMNGDMNKVYKCFLASDYETWKENFLYMLDLNEDRKVLVDKYLAQIMSTKQKYEPYIYMSDAPGGILGLLAMKLMSMKGIPCIVLGKDFDGSGRSESWYDLQGRLSEQGFKARGHSGAFGISFKNENEIKKCFEFLSSDILEVYNNLDFVDEAYDLTFGIDGDASLDLFEIIPFVKTLLKYEPFGHGFEKPSILLRFRKSQSEIKVMGAMKNHVKFILPQNIEVICWNSADMVDELLEDDIVEVAGEFTHNNFNDVLSVNFIGELLIRGDKNDDTL